MVDCGSGNSWRDAGCDTADQLLTMGCRSVERVILTHFDDDHINGVEHLLARINVETLTVPEETENDTERREILRLAEQYGVAVETVTEKTVLSFGGGELTFSRPWAPGGSNELGLTILAAWQGRGRSSLPAIWNGPRRRNWWVPTACRTWMC